MKAYRRSRSSTQISFFVLVAVLEPGRQSAYCETKAAQVGKLPVGGGGELAPLVRASGM